MKVVIVYIYPATAPKYENYVNRFVWSYAANATTVDHESVVVVNGGKPTMELLCRFGVLKNLRIFEHDNSGWDIGAFQRVAAEIPADLMVFFGTTSYIRGFGWLDRMVQAFDRHGDALYGSMGNQGMGAIVYPHIRTVGFWMPPALLNAYPMKVVRLDQRYPFEHGRNCLTQWVWNQGKKAFVVTWTREYEYPHWDSIPNGFHRGNQSALITGDRLSDPPYYHAG